MGEIRNAYITPTGKHERKYHPENPAVDWKTQS
jgi:hypothetical protein